MFHIDKDTGDIHIDYAGVTRICKSGYVTVTYPQAKEAHRYGWHGFGRVIGEPDLVTISRPMIGCVIDID